jgi:drug/metabolite transporter (DMT)-like permease
VQIPRARLLLGLSVGIVAISFASIFIRLAQAEKVPTLSIAAWRLVFASLFLLPYALATHWDELRDLSRRELGLLIAAGVFLGLHFASWIGSLDYTSVASSVVLVSMGPLFVGLGSWIFLKERLAVRVMGGILMAAVGSIVVSWGDLGQGQDQIIGDLLALVGAIMGACYLMIGRKVRTRRSLTAYVAPVYGVAMLTLLVCVLVGRQPMLGFSLPAYGWMLALGLVPQLIGHSTLNWALRHLSATYVSIVTLAEPLGSSILAYVILRETVSWPTAAGGVLILVGIYIASQAETR